MKSIVVFAVFVAFLFGLSGCSSTQVISENSLKHTSWQLISLNGKKAQFSAPVSLKFIEALQVSGSSGCNRYFGSASLQDNTLQVGNLGMTRKLCDEASNAVEQQFLALLQSGVKATFIEGKLQLSGEQTFLFKAVK
ncbi:META domain-containing protein [Pseudoalteromonas xiamenensis]|uniref:META domain-containing protein n=1 Tax=Pseudoalteromonas xiamenensis TaxID=882626 RepID=UPI0035F0D4E7